MKSLNELRIACCIDIGVRNFHSRILEQFGFEIFIMHSRMVHSDGIDRKKRKEIDESSLILCVIKTSSFRLFKVENHIKAIGENGFSKNFENAIGRDLCHRAIYCLETLAMAKFERMSTTKSK